MSDKISVDVFYKKRWLYLVIMGALTSLALPPAFLVPFIFITFPILYIYTEYSRSAKDAFFVGWWFGFGYWLIGIYWVAFSILTEADKFWWLVPFAVIGLPMMLAVYTGIATVVTYLVPRQRWQKILVLAVMWVLSEMLRSYVIAFYTLYGFPWNYIGYVWNVTNYTMQLGSVIGIFGLSLLTMIIALLPALAVTIKEEKGEYIISYMGIYKVMAVILTIIIIHSGFGVYRIHTTRLTMFEDMNIRLVQPNQTEHHKWHPVKKRAVVRKHIEMSQAPGAEKMQAIIWSESSVPYAIEENKEVMDEIKKAIPEGGILLTGAMRGERDESGEYKNIYSTLHAIDNEGGIRGVYDKYRLVAFGEYIPFRWMLPIDSIVGGTDFSKGPGPQTMITNRILPFSPLICYDAIFPQSVVNKGKQADWMLNITNDAWFEKRLQLTKDTTLQLSTGPYQHFQMVRMRAVEQGISIVRVANTGITANITPLGQVVGSIPLGKEGILDTNLIAPLATKTIYSRTGDTLLLLLMYICGLFTLLKQNLIRVF